jgi:hypothetical protein
MGLADGSVSPAAKAASTVLTARPCKYPSISPVSFSRKLLRTTLTPPMDMVHGYPPGWDRRQVL